MVVEGRFIGQAMALQNKGRAWTRYDFETLAGLPTTVVPGGTSRVTTLPAPTMASSPMLTPGRTTALPPIHTANPQGHTAFVALKPQRRGPNFSTQLRTVS
jgi:hypothetical protein